MLDRMSEADKSSTTHPDSNQVADPNLTAPNLTEELQPRPKPAAGKRRNLAIVGVLLLATVGFLGVRSLSSQPAKSGKGRNGRSQMSLVTVATVSQKTVPLQLQTIGTVQASSTVSVTPQASGRITGVYFKKGQMVHKGDLLFTLDDRTQAASVQQVEGTIARDQAQVEQAKATLAKDLGLVRQAEANLAKDEAQAQLAQAQSDRYNKLYQQGAISQDQAQQYATNSRVSAATLQADRDAVANARGVVKGDQAAIKTAEAVVMADRANLDNTKVQSSYTRIYAPIDGRAGNILVTAGNIVQANSNSPLVTITQVTPIQVAFSVPESRLPDIQKYMENGKLKVTVTFAGSNTPVHGVLSFVNNTVDNSTGTIQLIGDFDNRDGKLFPGQFVNTTLTLTHLQNAIVVPDRAVQNGPNGQFVFVVDPDDSTVDNVPVTVSSSINGLDVIQNSTLQPGDQIVTDGQANLVSGSKVRVKTGGNPSGDRAKESDSDSTHTRDRTSHPMPAANEDSSTPAHQKSSVNHVIPNHASHLKGKTHSDKPQSTQAGGDL